MPTCGSCSGSSSRGRASSGTMCLTGPSSSTSSLTGRGAQPRTRGPRASARAMGPATPTWAAAPRAARRPRRARGPAGSSRRLRVGGLRCATSGDGDRCGMGGREGRGALGSGGCYQICGRTGWRLECVRAALGALVSGGNATATWWGGRGNVFLFWLLFVAWHPWSHLAPEGTSGDRCWRRPGPILEPQCLPQVGTGRLQ
mmetsp:Transcript_30278/g.72039  ORF Transcript_30278/g.72039 Transcript_30278/m.72039 type:complete len:201 (+) Transcript_30278:1294-1896(+)